MWKRLLNGFVAVLKGELLMLGILLTLSFVVYVITLF
jgi:hypothetical protein